MFDAVVALSDELAVTTSPRYGTWDAATLTIGPVPDDLSIAARRRLMPAEGAARPGERLLELVSVMDRLRSPGGCPWDARQTHESLVEYLIEEAYETVEAIEESDRDGLREELGDLLLQVVFHARIAAEDPNEPWTIDDVADGIVAKLVSRHPHVFAGAAADTAEEVEANWHAMKAKEKGRASVTDGIPSALPSLVHAGKGALAERRRWPDRLPEPALSDEATEAMRAVDSEADFGDLLLALVARGPCSRIRCRDCRPRGLATAHGRHPRGRGLTVTPPGIPPTGRTHRRRGAGGRSGVGHVAR